MAVRKVSALVSSTACVHRIPLHVRDDRETPLVRNGTAGVLGLIWGKREAEYFFEKGWGLSSISGFPRNSRRDSWEVNLIRS